MSSDPCAKFFDDPPAPREHPRCDRTVPASWSRVMLVARLEELRERWLAGERSPAVEAEGKAIRAALAKEGAE